MRSRSLVVAVLLGVGCAPHPAKQPTERASEATPRDEKTAKAATETRRPPDRPSEPTGGATHRGGGAADPSGGAGQRSNGAPAQTTPSPYVVTVRDEPYETFVDVRHTERERPSMQYRPRRKELRFEWDRARSRADQTSELAQMLEAVHQRYGAAAPSTRLLTVLDLFMYPEYVERLARHASSDPAWTKAAGREGKPGAAALHDYIVAATRGGAFHPELDAIFAPLGLRTELSAVEKCSAARPGGKGDLGAWLASREIRAKAALPAGCLMAWFRLVPLPKP